MDSTVDSPVSLSRDSQLFASSLRTPAVGILKILKGSAHFKSEKIRREAKWSKKVWLHIIPDFGEYFPNPTRPPYVRKVSRFGHHHCHIVTIRVLQNTSTFLPTCTTYSASVLFKITFIPTDQFSRQNYLLFTFGIW